MRIAQETLIVLGLFFLQQLVGVADWGVDLPLIFVVLKGLRTTPVKATAWGFFLGAAQDIFTADWIGLHLASDALAGYLSSLSRRHVFRERVLTQSFLVFAMMALRQLAIWGLLKWDGTAPPAAEAFTVVLHSTALTGLVGLLACWLVVRLRPRRQDPATA